MNLSKYKRWRVLLHRVIAKQQAKKEQSHPVCSHAVISTKMWGTLIQNIITKQRVKDEQIKRKETCSWCLVNVFKF